MSILELIDTAVKIGLGALIASISAYFLAEKSHLNEIRKIKCSDKKKLSQDIAIRLEKVEYFFNEFTVNVAKENHESAMQSLIEASHEAYTIRALSNIIGSDQLVSTLDKTARKVEKIFDVYDSEDVNYQELSKLGKELTAINRSAYPVIREVYDSSYN